MLQRCNGRQPLENGWWSVYCMSCLRLSVTSPATDVLLRATGLKVGGLVVAFQQGRGEAAGYVD
jgi:hypothetical protein